MKFTIPVNALRAVELFAATKDIRYYLNGTYVCALDADTLQLVATTGSILAQYRHTRDRTADEPYKAGESYILPVGLTQGFKPVRNMICATVTADPNGWSVDYAGYQRSGKPIDGKFPDTDRIWPTRLELGAGHFDFKLLALIQKACDLLDARGPTLFQGGAKTSSMFVVNEQLAGVIMPWTPTHDQLPAWSKTTLSTLDTRLIVSLAEAHVDGAPSPATAFNQCVDAVAVALDRDRIKLHGAVAAEAAMIKATRDAAKARAVELQSYDQKRAAAKRKAGKAKRAVA